MIISHILSVFVILSILGIVLYVVFIVICLFKKTCRWKKCPFRSKIILDDLKMSGCTKCLYPYDKEEEEVIKAEFELLRKKYGLR